MISYAFPFIHSHAFQSYASFAFASEEGGGSGIPGPSDILAGPYGFLVTIVVCAFWGLREWRKGRELDVENFKKRAIDAEARADTLETKNNEEVGILTAKIEALQSDTRALRDQHFREQESATAKYYAARQMLIASGVPKEEIP